MATSDPSPDEAAADRLVDDAILKVVWREIGVKWRELARELQIPDSKLDNIFHQYNTQGGLSEMAYQMLRAWREAASTNARVSVLTAALEQAERIDLVRKIMTISPTMKEEHPSEEADLLKRLVSSLHDRYRNYIMKGLPWLDNIIRLADYYVNLRVKTGDRNKTSTQHIHKAFQSAFSANKRPLRVLVEGPPGYGKTTLAAKLCFDHTTREAYMKNFDLVLHSSLRRFEGNLEEMLCSAADLSDSYEWKKVFMGILNNPSTRILLVLDGFDEVPKQHVKPILALLQGHRFRHVAVIVTSRPGHFTHEKWERENDGCPKLCEVTVDWSRIWHSRIEIVGIDDSMKEEFIVKHLENFPEEIKTKALCWLRKMAGNKIIESEFFECPLFLLIIMLLATDEETGSIHNLRTPTDLYKSVFNFIIRRYCSKQNEPVNETVDLFTISEDSRPFYVDLLCQFGEFALWALIEDKLSFSQEAILRSDPPRDPRILELGLLTQSVSTVGFREKVVCEPVHKSLLEFSAAYALWLLFLPESARDSWAEKVVRLWRCGGYGRPFWLILLEGLMRDRFAALLDVLSPYACCGVWQWWIRHSVSQIDLTEPVLSSLTPFLPTHWIQKKEECFSRTQHDALLLHGIRQGRIKFVSMTRFLATPMLDDVVVDTAVFSGIKGTVVNVYRFNCRHLVLGYSHVCHGLETWIPATINCQTLSFVFLWYVSRHLRLLRSVLKAGALKDIQIQIRCLIMETADVVQLTELIKMEKLKILSLDGVFSASEQLHGLLRAAANSSQLTTLLFDGLLWFVDLCHLCGGVQKTWQLLSITDDNIDFPPQTDQTFQTNCLVLDFPNITEAVLRFLEVCQVTSLQCKLALLVHIETLPLLPQHLTELNVLLDGTAQQCHLPHLPNLTVLVFTMTEYVPRSFAVREFLFGSRSLLRLKGIEIWQAGWNMELSVEFVQCVSGCLEQSIPVPLCEGTLRSFPSLQLEYFLFQSTTADDEDEEDDFLAHLGDMAVHLRNKSLSRFDIVTEGPCSPDLLDMFSPTQGFRVESGMWGTRSEDTILRRMKYDTQHLSLLNCSCFNCYSIRHTDN